jgi:Acetyltransferase (GNAT) domain
MITVSEYHDLSAVARIRDLWRFLWWKTPRASFFQSYEWFERHSRQTAGLEPRVFVVAVAGRPVGLVPWVEKRVGGPIRRRRVLTNSLSPQGFCCGPLGSAPRLTLDTALAHAQATGRFDLFELEDLERRGTPRTADSIRLDRPQGSGVADESRAIVECNGDWVRYLRALPPEVRELYQHSERALAELGEVEYVRYRPEGTTLGDDNPRWELLKALKRKVNSAKSADRRTSLEAMHVTATAIAGVDLNVLRLNNEPIAWIYSYRCDGRLELQRLHARPDHAAAASSVLLGRMLHDGFRRGDESYLFDRQTTRKLGGWQTTRAITRRLNSPTRGSWSRLLGGKTQA